MNWRRISFEKKGSIFFSFSAFKANFKKQKNKTKLIAVQVVEKFNAIDKHYFLVSFLFLIFFIYSFLWLV